MADRLIRNWWALGARGAAGLLFGVLTLTWPELALSFFAVYALMDGVLTLITAARYRTRARDVAGPRDLVLVAGVSSTALGVVAFVLADAPEKELLGLVATWALVTGAAEIALAVRNRRRIPLPALLAAAGGAQVALAAILIGGIASGRVGFGWTAGAIMTIVAGALRLALAARARRVTWAARTPSGRTATTDSRANATAEETPSGVAA